MSTNDFMFMKITSAKSIVVDYIRGAPVACCPYELLRTRFGTPTEFIKLYRARHHESLQKWDIEKSLDDIKAFMTQSKVHSDFAKYHYRMTAGVSMYNFDWTASEVEEVCARLEKIDIAS